MFGRLCGQFVLTTFLHSGRTAVDYFHSHMDVFLSFGLEQPKTWTLINPAYHDQYALARALSPTLD